MQKLTRKEVIDDFHEVHGYRYDYSKFVYNGSGVSSIIICEKHGEFTQSADKHKIGQGCKKCAGKGLTDLERIEELNEVHGYRYDYSEFKYKSPKSKVCVICEKHGKFSLTYDNHKSGQGCGKCVGKGLTDLERIEEYNIIHNYRYDYSLFKFISNNINVDIICEKHGIFQQTPSNHKQGKGCKKCSGKGLTDLERIEEYNKVHNFEYDYSKFKYIDGDIQSIITCKKHGDFKQKPRHHLFGSGCTKCNLSKGELRVYKYLETHNIKLKAQKTFKNCKNKKVLPFDFYLPVYNICIEYDGIQHYEVNEYYGGEKEFKSRKRNDKIKNKYCKDNNIELIRIPYWDFDNIENILENKLK